MSEQLNLKQSVPSDVAELWAQLHAEASANCEALKPQTSRRAVVIILVISLLFMAAALFSANEFWFKPQEAARVATATARALALDASGRKTATAMAGTATFEAEQGQAAFLATSTAQAATATTEAQRSAASLAGTATAQAVANRAMATAQAEANNATSTAIAIAEHCDKPTSYTLEVTTTPQLDPAPGYVYVTDKAWPAVHADWRITNTGACEWRSVQLKTLDRQEMDTRLFRDGEEIRSVAPGESATVALYFPRLAAPSQGEWYLTINTWSLFDHAPHLYLDLGDQVWIQVVDPTPTPTPTSTPTPLPSPTPEPTVCRTVCDKCEKCEQDEFGNTKCKQVDCNCREECD